MPVIASTTALHRSETKDEQRMVQLADSVDEHGYDYDYDYDYS